MRLFFARIRDIFHILAKFLTKDIWALDFSELSTARKNMIKNLQAILLTAKDFARDRVGREAIALSWFTTLAFVPMIAVILFISNGFGFDQYLYNTLTESFPTNTQLVQVIIEYARNMIKETESGTFGWISFLSSSDGTAFPGTRTIVALTTWPLTPSGSGVAVTAHSST